ncbi:uncharacterized protein METZ01_LOCUS272120 [marine metagenome]|uniref:Uncharacterized protein n=1 Tax=marine metagenome TaxID=408172 RepID=A0A382K5H6_9ZZZZ|tara:strand:- start:49 stop:501 length:453 start_codon:yes stop_codon:yes gene_type:complete
MAGLTTAAILVLTIGCSQGESLLREAKSLLREAKGGFTSTWAFSPDHLEGSIIVKLECCDKETTFIGEMQVASVVIENNTDINIQKIELIFNFEGKEGFNFPEISTESKRELGIGQKMRLKLHLYDYETEEFIDPRDIKSSDDTLTIKVN